MSSTPHAAATAATTSKNALPTFTLSSPSLSSPSSSSSSLSLSSSRRWISPSPSRHSRYYLCDDNPSPSPSPSSSSSFSSSPSPTSTTASGMLPFFGRPSLSSHKGKKRKSIKKQSPATTTAAMTTTTTTTTTTTSTSLAATDAEASTESNPDKGVNENVNVNVDANDTPTDRTRHYHLTLHSMPPHHSPLLSSHSLTLPTIRRRPLPTATSRPPSPSSLPLLTKVPLCLSSVENHGAPADYSIMHGSATSMLLDWNRLELDAEHGSDDNHHHDDNDDNHDDNDEDRDVRSVDTSSTHDTGRKTTCTTDTGDTTVLAGNLSDSTSPSLVVESSLAASSYSYPYPSRGRQVEKNGKVSNNSWSYVEALGLSPVVRHDDSTTTTTMTALAAAAAAATSTATTTTTTTLSFTPARARTVPVYSKSDMEPMAPLPVPWDHETTTSIHQSLSKLERRPISPPRNATRYGIATTSTTTVPIKEAVDPIPPSSLCSSRDKSRPNLPSHAHPPHPTSVPKSKSKPTPQSDEGTYLSFASTMCHPMSCMGRRRTKPVGGGKNDPRSLSWSSFLFSSSSSSSPSPSPSPSQVRHPPASPSSPSPSCSLPPFYIYPSTIATTAADPLPSGSAKDGSGSHGKSSVGTFSSTTTSSSTSSSPPSPSSSSSPTSVLVSSFRGFFMCGGENDWNEEEEEVEKTEVSAVAAKAAATATAAAATAKVDTTKTMALATAMCEM